jgi:hypothetical protein
VQVLAHLARYLTTAIPSVYDVYVAIPLRIERTLRSRSDDAFDHDVVDEQEMPNAEVAR